MNMEHLTKLKTKIEQMDKIHHVKILQILINNGIKYSENRNGIFINMNEFDKKTINDIHTTLEYIYKQEKTLNDVEKEKNLYQNLSTFVLNRQTKFYILKL